MKDGYGMKAWQSWRPTDILWLVYDRCGRSWMDFRVQMVVNVALVVYKCEGIMDKRSRETTRQLSKYWRAYVLQFECYKQLSY